MFKALKEQIGKGNFSEEEIDLVSCSSDASQIKGQATMIIWAKDVQDVHNAVNYAKRNNLNIVPRGAATGLSGGAVPQKSIVIDLTNMNKFTIGEDTAIVQPGVVLDDLNAASNKKFPVIPGSHKVATIGGMIATNAAGLRALKYGAVIDWIEELEVVDGTGKYYKIKGKKIDHFCGKEGITGIVVRAKLKLTEFPEVTSTSVLGFDTLTDLMEAVKELKDKAIGMEYVDKFTSELSRLGDKFHLLVEFEGDEGEITDPEECKAVWDLRDTMFPLVASKGYTLIEDPKIDLDKMDKYLYWLHKNNIPSFGHIGMGIVHPHFKPNSSKVESLFAIVKKLGGTVTGEHGVGLSKKEFVDSETQQKLKELKEIYDPENIMNRGKIINGI